MTLKYKTLFSVVCFSALTLVCRGQCDDTAAATGCRAKYAKFMDDAQKLDDDSKIHNAKRSSADTDQKVHEWNEKESELRERFANLKTRLEELKDKCLFVVDNQCVPWDSQDGSCFKICMDDKGHRHCYELRNGRISAVECR
jgi:hypothetical protein